MFTYAIMPAGLLPLRRAQIYRIRNMRVCYAYRAHALGQMAVAERVRKVFAIQEERKKQYGRLEK